MELSDSSSVDGIADRINFASSGNKLGNSKVGEGVL
jgi:hypothetical protein